MAKKIIINGKVWGRVLLGLPGKSRAGDALGQPPEGVPIISATQPQPGEPPQIPRLGSQHRLQFPPSIISDSPISTPSSLLSARKPHSHLWGSTPWVPAMVWGQQWVWGPRSPPVGPIPSPGPLPWVLHPHGQLRPCLGKGEHGHTLERGSQRQAGQGCSVLNPWRALLKGEMFARCRG